VTTFPVARVVVNVVAETAAKESNDHKYRRYQLSSTVRPRNFSYDFAQNYKLINNGSGSPGDSSGSPGDTSGSPADSTDDQVLPPYEPPIRIATARVLSMSLTDLNENDAQEGSQTTVDGQGDPDIILGTKASASNNLSAWFDGQPGLYSENGGRLYRSNPNYFGNKFMSGLINVLFGVKITDSQAGYRAIRLDKVRGIPLAAKEYEIETEMLIKSIKRGLKIVEVPVTRDRRAAGRTNFKRIRNGLIILGTILKLRFSAA